MTNRPCDAVYGIGIDTGGTYTDAVLFDLRKHQIISVSKRPTIHHCLELSIIQALDDIFPVREVESIRMIAFSTTLATNTIAEGRMGKVGLIVIGHVKPFDAPVVSVRYVVASEIRDTIVVHGWLHNQECWILHAWCEFYDQVIDLTETQEPIDKSTYYRIMGVTPQRSIRYDRQEFFALAAKHGHFGPFDKAFFFAETSSNDPLKRDSVGR